MKKDEKESKGAGKQKMPTTGRPRWREKERETKKKRDEELRNEYAGTEREKKDER